MLVLVMVTACAKDTQGVLPSPSAQEEPGDQNTATTDNTGENADGSSDEPVTPVEDDSTGGENGTGQEPANEEKQPDPADQVDFSDAQSVTVLVNKEYALPEDYEPSDLVYPDVRFTFSEKIEKRMMRSEAAAALEKLFDGAEEDGIYLAGVSAYRSHSTQTSLFNRYVKKDGLEKAKTYSAVPGHSEHETGLAIDVSGSDGKCAAEDCFGDTKEAEWLAKHATEYGFIIRYPEGKEGITGYKYEPWHLRYVGTEISSDIAERGITLEEYYNAVPVTANP
ncbi:M15 family metallopeptidase [Paenibacillus sp. MSJ-6]|uniref:M15 family metallopeptidase n=2 Tax=Paenibacillus brevis TaxID=2841508 RepID=A0ABS6FNQ8_9BACL|nr:M15 family metallopeptidase [Paenibacillus brevis]